MPSRSTVALVPALLVLATCGSSRGAGSAEPTDATSAPLTAAADVDEVYRRAEQTLTSMGIDHVTVDVGFESPGRGQFTAVTELWLDAPGDRYREDTTITGTVQGQPINETLTEIGLAATTWREEGTAPSIRCRGVDIATSHLLGCPGPLATWTTAVEPGDDTSVLVLVTTGEEAAEDSTTTFTRRTEVDAATGLPRRQTTEAIHDDGSPQAQSWRLSYHHEPLDPAELDPAWFTPDG